MVRTTHNIQEIRELYNLTQGEFALALGITRELVNKMEKGRIPVSKATRLRLEKFLQERQSENISQELNYIGRPTHRSSQPYYLQRREQKQERAPLQVPLVAQKAQAGYVKSYDQVDYIDTLEKFSLPPGVNPMGAVWSYFEVDGDSMEPTLYAGDIILASMLPEEDWDDVKNFCVYVILAKDQLLVKRIYRRNPGEWILISDNEELYSQVVLPVSEVKQVWTFRRHIRARVPQPKEFQIVA